MPAGPDAGNGSMYRVASMTPSTRARRWAFAVGLGLLAGCASNVPLAPWPGPVGTGRPQPATPIGTPSAAARSGSASGSSASSASAASSPAASPPGASPPFASPSPATAPAPAPEIESPGLAARFPDPAITYRTPAFAADHPGFTSNAELRDLMRRLVREGDGSPGPAAVRLVEVGSSQAGVPLEALVFSRAWGSAGTADPAGSAGAALAPAAPAASITGNVPRAARPTVLLVGQQHGNEPAGSEALLVVAQALADGSLGAVLERIDVVVFPRANPDGAASERRTTASGIDANRDHLLLRTPEAQAQAQLMREFNPVVVVDSHEFTALGRYVEKFGAAQRYDALVQYAMTANVPEFVSKASEEWFRLPMLKALKAQGQSTEWYHTTSADLADKKVSMGGVQPDTARNVNGLRNSISFLVETRGIGIGRAHLARRVQAHVTAVTSVLQSAAAHADDLARLRRFVDADLVAKACHGDVIVEAAATPSEYVLQMVDPRTGADKTVDVAWDSALALTVLKRRARPCGYWLGADQVDAALRLRDLGVQVLRLDEAGDLRGEAYAETARTTARRGDVRGSIADAADASLLKVALVPALIDAPVGSYYVGLDQPLANLIVAALEPDTQNSFVANGIVTELRSQARLLARPEVRMTPMP